MKIHLIAAALWLLPGFARAAELKVLATTAVKDAYLELVPGFEAASGDKVVTTWSSTVKIKEQITAGPAYDLVIVGASNIDAFIQAGTVRAGSRVDLMQVGVGVAVRAGSPKPDISSGAGVRQALLAAKSVAYSTGPSGDYVLALFGKMGITEQMQPKLKVAPAGVPVAHLLAGGQADIGFQQVSELIHEPGITLVGPLPPDIQHVTMFSSGLPAGAAEPAAAKALQAYLTAPAADEAIRKNGLAPAGR